MSSGHNHIGPLSAALNISQKLAAVLPDQHVSPTLRVVPLDNAGKTTGTGIPLVADSVSIVG